MDLIFGRRRLMSPQVRKDPSLSSTSKDRLARLPPSTSTSKHHHGANLIERLLTSATPHEEHVHSHARIHTHSKLHSHKQKLLDKRVDSTEDDATNRTDSPFAQPQPARDDASGIASIPQDIASSDMPVPSLASGPVIPTDTNDSPFLNPLDAQNHIPSADEDTTSPEALLAPESMLPDEVKGPLSQPSSASEAATPTQTSNILPTFSSAVEQTPSQTDDNLSPNLPLPTESTPTTGTGGVASDSSPAVNPEESNQESGTASPSASIQQGPQSNVSSPSVAPPLTPDETNQSPEVFPSSPSPANADGTVQDPSSPASIIPNESLQSPSLSPAAVPASRNPGEPIESITDPAISSPTAVEAPVPALSASGPVQSADSDDHQAEPATAPVPQQEPALNDMSPAVAVPPPGNAAPIAATATTQLSAPTVVPVTIQAVPASAASQTIPGSQSAPEIQTSSATLTTPVDANFPPLSSPAQVMPFNRSTASAPLPVPVIPVASSIVSIAAIGPLATTNPTSPVIAALIVSAANLEANGLVYANPTSRVVANPYVPPSMGRSSSAGSSPNAQTSALSTPVAIPSSAMSVYAASAPLPASAASMATPFVMAFPPSPASTVMAPSSINLATFSSPAPSSTISPLNSTNTTVGIVPFASPSAASPTLPTSTAASSLDPAVSSTLPDSPTAGMQVPGVQTLGMQPSGAQSSQAQPTGASSPIDTDNTPNLPSPTSGNTGNPPTTAEGGNGAASATSGPGLTGNQNDSNGSSGVDTPSVVGGVIGGIAGFALLLLLLLFLLRRVKQKRKALETQRALTSGDAAAAAGPALASGAQPRLPEMSSTGPLALAAAAIGSTARKLGGSPRPNSIQPPPIETGQSRGFERVSGRKLPSQFSPGMEGPPGSINYPSGVSHYTSGVTESSGALPEDPFADSNSTVVGLAGASPSPEAFVRPGPGRTPEIQQVRDPRISHLASPSTPTMPHRPGMAQRYPSNDGSSHRGSRFQEDFV